MTTLVLAVEPPVSAARPSSLPLSGVVGQDSGHAAIGSAKPPEWRPARNLPAGVAVSPLSAQRAESGHLHAAISLLASSHSPQMSDSAFTRRSTSPSLWTGDGVMRSRSVPLGTVG